MFFGLENLHLNVVNGYKSLLIGGNGMETLKRLVIEEEGATMVEYGLIVALIAVVAMVGAKTLGTAVHTLFDGLAKDIKK